MVTIGDTTLPGTQVSVDSDTSFSVNIGSPGNAGIVGEANLGGGIEQGSADPDTVYRVTTPNQARSLFGNNSLLTQNVRDALQMGAYPVWAVATSSTTVTGEDLSGVSSTSFTLNNAPIRDDPDTISITIDGTSKTVLVTYDDPHTLSPGTDEAYVNPVNGKVEVDAAPADTDTTNDTADYEYFDYATSYDTLAMDKGDTLDFIFSCTEEANSVTALKDVVLAQEQEFNFMVGVAGAGMNIDDTSYSNPFDTSRMQLLYPTRSSDGSSIIGGFAGLRASIGIQASVMKRRIGAVDRVRKTLRKSEKENLDAENVVPVENFSPGVRIRTDATCVADSNTEEQNMSTGLSRLIVDYVTEIVYETSESYIGKLHNDDARNALRSQISNQISALVEADAVIAFTISVTEQDSMTAKVDVGVETVKALRNVIADVTAGQVE